RPGGAEGACNSAHALDALMSTMRKLEGEQRVAKACERHLILRTAWLYSPWGTNQNNVTAGSDTADHRCRPGSRELGKAEYGRYLLAIAAEGLASWLLACRGGCCNLDQHRPMLWEQRK